MRRISKLKRLFCGIVMPLVLMFTMTGKPVQAEVVTTMETETYEIYFRMDRFTAAGTTANVYYAELLNGGLYSNDKSIPTGLSYSVASASYDKSKAITLSVNGHSPTSGRYMGGYIRGTCRVIGKYGRTLTKMEQRTIVTLTSFEIDGTVIPLDPIIFTGDVVGEHKWKGTSGNDATLCDILTPASYTFPQFSYQYPKKTYFAPNINSITPPNNSADQQVTAVAPAGTVADISLDIDTAPAFDPLYDINLVELGSTLTAVTPLWGGPATATDAEVTTVNGEPMNDGTSYTGIGKSSWEQKVTDFDGDATTFTRDATIYTSQSPDITVTYGTGAQEPDGTVLDGVAFDTTGANQYPNSMNGWSNQPLEVVVDSTMTGDYYNNLTDDQGGVYWGSAVTTAASHQYTQETISTGWDVTGGLMDVAQSTLLSNTDTDNIKIDLTNPSPSVLYQAATNEFVDDSSDALSGVNPALTKVAVVPYQAASPAQSEYRDLTAWETCPQYGNAGDYDVYVMAYDLAGNTDTALAIQQLALDGLVTNLEINKTVAGKYGNMAKEYEVTITLEDDKGAPVTDTYNTSGTSITSISFVNGEAVINLKHGETLTIEDIPNGYAYQVEETDAVVISGEYIATYTGTGTIGSAGVNEVLNGTTARVEILNSRDTDPLPPSTGVQGGNTQAAVGVMSCSMLMIYLIGSARFYKKRRRA